MAHGISQTKLKRFIQDSSSMRNDPDYPLFLAGINEGKQQMRKKILTILEDKYIGPNAPDRDSVEATAILMLARELSEAINADTE